MRLRVVVLQTVRKECSSRPWTLRTRRAYRDPAQLARTSSTVSSCDSLIFPLERSFPLQHMLVKWLVLCWMHQSNIQIVSYFSSLGDVAWQDTSIYKL